MNNIKRHLSFVLAVLMLVLAIPVGDIVAFATAGEVKIDRIDILKTVYEDNIKYVVTVKSVKGIDLDRLSIGIKPDEGDAIIGTRDEEIANIFTLTIDNTVGRIPDEILLIIDGQVVESIELSFGNGTRKNPNNKYINTSDFEGLIKMEIKKPEKEFKMNSPKLESGNNIIKIDNLGNGNYRVNKVEYGKIEKGSYSLVIENEIKENISEIASKINTKVIYKDFYVFNDNFGFGENVLDFNPSRGFSATEESNGTEVDIFTTGIGEARLDENMSVFMTKEKKVNFNKDDMIPNENIEYILKENSGLDHDIIRFEIPEKITEKGEYYFTLTNKVNEDNIENSVYSRYRIDNKKFNLVGIDNGVYIDSLDPNKGSIGGLNSTVKGKNMIQINKNRFTNKPDDEDINMNIKKEVKKGENHEHLQVEYTIGKKNDVRFDGIPLNEGDKIIREIKILIGDYVGFPEKYNEIKPKYNSNMIFDFIDIIIPSTIKSINPKQDVVIEITDFIKRENGDKEEVSKERDILKDGFTYESLSHELNDLEVSPDIIPFNDAYKSDESFIITLTGEHFSVYRYVDNNGKEFIKYPKVDILNIDGSDKLFHNADGDESFIRVLDDGGNIVDGRNNNEKGTKLQIKVKKGYGVNEELFKDGESKQSIRVRNPIRKNNEVLEYDSYDTAEILFKLIGKNKPRIKKIDPSIITTEGYENVNLEGTGFKNSKIYLDGEELTTYTVNDMNEIIFDAPPKSEGNYEIMVQNDDGAVATTEIKYQDSETDLKIMDFQPKEGTKDMWVTVTGQDFVVPSNYYVDNKENEYRFIGTRVLLGDKDVNDYHTSPDSVTGKNNISLQDYDIKEDLFYIENFNINAVDYIDSLILKEENEKGYYSIYREANKGYVITNASDKSINIEKQNNEIKANVNGKTHEIKYILNSDESTKLIIGDLKFEVKTPYKIDGDGKIVGKNVKINNSGELRFKVPLMESGNYKIKLRNPDGQEDSMGDFKYDKEPNSNPEIDSITPKEGPTSGGNIVIIKAKKGRESDRFFEDTEVFFHMEKAEEVEYIDKHTIAVKVPSYEGDLDNNRKTVVVTVKSGTGGDSMENGYTYIKAGAEPVLTGVDPAEGPVAGNQRVTIFGRRFKYFESEGYDLNKNGKIDDLETGEIFIPDKNKEDGSGEFKKLGNLTDEEWVDYVNPILPKIYFGEKKAEWDLSIKKIDAAEMRVITPKSESEKTVNVYIENNDYGKSKENRQYKYTGKTPIIDDVSPERGGQDGGIPIGIMGKNLLSSDMRILDKNKKVNIKKMPKIQFGKLNKDDNDASIKEESIDYGNKINIEIGDLKLKYEIKDEESLGEIKLSIKRNNKEYKFEYNSYDNKELFIPLNLLVNDETQKNLPIDELVRIERISVPNARPILKLERGFSTKVESISDKYLKASLPNYFSQGSVDVRIINPDGTEAVKKNTFNYDAGSANVSITDILNREGKSPYKEDKMVNLIYSSKDKMTIVGNGFTNPVAEIKLIDRGETGEDKINVKNINVQTMVTYDKEKNPNKLTIDFEENFFDINDVNRIYELQVVNDEGKGSAFSDKKRVRVVLPGKLRIESLTPNMGPTSGGTEVIINGEGFSEEDSGVLEVIFGTEKGEVVSVESSEKIIVKTPPNTTGLKDVFVNIKYPEDSTNTDESAGHFQSFTYVSNPVIDKIVDPENDKSLINNISIDGGDLIKIKGSDFMDGSKVIFNPDLRPLADNETEASIEGELVVINGKRFELNYDADKEVTAAKQDDGQGQDTYIEFIDGQNLMVKTPTGSIGDSGVIVINPDGAVSNLYNIEYGIPEIGAPMDVQADLIYDEFIRVKWSGVSAANQYEIYVKIEDGDYQFIGSTTETNFAYENIESRTKYRFMVKAIGEYGSSKPLEESESNSVTTGRDAGPEDIDGELGEYTNVERQGENANITIGTRDFGSEGYTIDLTRGELAGAKKLSIRMPAEIVSGYGSGEIRILGPDYSMSFRPEVFRNSRIDENRNNNAGVVFNIQPYKGPKGSSTGSIVSGPIYDLNAKVFVGMNGTDVDRLAGGIDLVLDDNPMITQSRRLRNLSLSRYYEAGNNWVNTMRVDRMALYAITGSRR